MHACMGHERTVRWSKAPGPHPTSQALPTGRPSLHMQVHVPAAFILCMARISYPFFCHLNKSMIEVCITVEFTVPFADALRGLNWEQ